jgi:uncharacterized protein (DUF4415 family)
MSDGRIAELENFKTKNFTDCPVQTPEQLQEFKPKYAEGNLHPAGSVRVPDSRLYKPIKKTVQIRLDADVLEWLKQAGPGYQTRANAILRQAMLQSAE